MAYLIKNDYKTYIQGDYLRQLTQADDSKRTIEENASIQQIIKKLTQKYDLDLEFRDLTVWDRNREYGAGDRVYIDLSENGFNQWGTLTQYDIGEPVFYNDKGYYCTIVNNDAVFTPSKWALAGSKYDIFYAGFPTSCTLTGLPNPTSLTNPFAPVFDYKNIYSRGDVVYWKGNTYVCNQPSVELTHFAKLQYAQYTNLPYNNVFPDDPINNNAGQYWKDRTVFVVEVGTPLTNSAWVAGDNRNQLIKDAMIMITVFKLSPLIAPQNRPDVWLDNYRMILNELKEAALGENTLLLPLKQPNNAVRTYNGGNIKNVNNY